MTKKTQNNAAVKARVKKHKADLLVALEASLGIVTTACRKVGLDRKTFYSYVNTDEEFAAAVKEIHEVALDFAESALHQQIKAGVPASTIFFLKTQGKKRDYIERTEHSGPGGDAIRHEHKHDLKKLSTEDLLKLKEINDKLND